MADDQINYAEVRRKVEQRLKVQKRGARIGFFVANLVMFVTFTLITWALALTNGSSGATATNSILPLLLLLPTLGWGTGLLMHFLSLLTDSGVMDKSMRERLVMREIGEELLGQEADETDEMEKPKRRAEARRTANDVAMRLSDDGELTPVEQETPKRSADRGNSA